jgi:hypothetical protein
MGQCSGMSPEHCPKRINRRDTSSRRKLGGMVAAAAPVPGHVLATRRFGAETVLVARIAGPSAFCPRGYLLAALRNRKVVARRSIRPARFTGALCGTSFRWLAVGRFVSVDIHDTASIGEEAQVYRLREGRFRLIHVFGADRIRPAAGGGFVLTWITASRSPRGHVREVWRWRNGRFRLVSSR